MTKIALPSVVETFRRRQIQPDQVLPVKQGTLNLWYFCNALVGELVSNTIHMTSNDAYINTTPPQEIADDIYTLRQGDDPALQQWTSAEMRITSRQAQAILTQERGETVPISSITHACRQGHIRNAQKQGRDWTFRERDFWQWLNDRPKPGRKPAK